MAPLQQKRSVHEIVKQQFSILDNIWKILENIAKFFGIVYREFMFTR